MQALGPLESPIEIGSSRLRVAHVVAKRYAAEHESVFGPLPPLADTARFPADGGPGSAAWTTMSAADRDATTKIFVSVAEAIAAYERTFRVAANRLDRYVAGDASSLTNDEKAGLHAFFVAGCAQCHYGPRLTDDAYHVVGFATGRADGVPDCGAVDGFALLGSSPFSRAGSYSDSVPLTVRRPSFSASSLSSLSSMRGAFRTPTLRGLPTTAPYGHGGTLATIEEVVAFYGRVGPAASEAARSVGTVAPLFPLFDVATGAQLSTFLRVLTQ